MTPPGNPETPPPDGRTGDRAVRTFFAAVLGFVVAIVLDVILNLQGFSFSGPNSFSPAQIAISWVITLALGFGLYKLHHWALYGMLGGYAALFLLFLTNGIFGPYTCFGTYGYPSPP